MRSHLCRKVYAVSDVTYVCIDGESTCNSLVRMVPGDPEGLLAAKGRQDKEDAKK